MKAVGALFGVTALIAMVVAPVSEQHTAPIDDRLRVIASHIAGLELRRQLASATPATIDSLLALCADSVVYEHPNAGAIVRGKIAMRRNMLQFMGSIRAVEADTPRVTIGHGVAIVESHVRMEVEDGGKWVPVRRDGIRVIEFAAGGLVRRVIDYPW